MVMQHLLILVFVSRSSVDARTVGRGSNRARILATVTQTTSALASLPFRRMRISADISSQTNPRTVGPRSNRASSCAVVTQATGCASLRTWPQCERIQHPIQWLGESLLFIYIYIYAYIYIGCTYICTYMFHIYI
jgi:hypothetical protein